MMKKALNLFNIFLTCSVMPLLAANNSNYSTNYSTPSYSNQISWANSYADAVSQSQMSSKPILILFTGTTWCPACMKLEREVLSKPQFAQAIGNRFIFLKAEFPEYSEETLNRSPYKSLLDRYGIDAFPAIVVVNASGTQLFTVNYQAGGPEVYIKELTQKLGQQTAIPAQQSYYNPNQSNNQRSTSNQGYYNPNQSNNQGYYTPNK